jgi:hypothetical protein
MDYFYSFHSERLKYFLSRFAGFLPLQRYCGESDLTGGSGMRMRPGWTPIHGKSLTDR